MTTERRRFILIPWNKQVEHDTDFSESSSRVGWSKDSTAKVTHSTKTFKVVYRDDVDNTVFDFSNTDSSDVMIYVRGHGDAGMDYILPKDKQELSAYKVTYKDLCKLLIDKGLKESFRGKIKFYNCCSGDRKGEELSFACRCAAFLRKKGYKNAVYIGYHDKIRGSYVNSALGVHKWKTHVDANTPNAEKWRTKSQQIVVPDDDKLEAQVL